MTIDFGEITQMSSYFSQPSKQVPTPFTCSIQSFLPQILFTNNSIAQLHIYPYRTLEITRTNLHKISINTQIYLIYYYHYLHFHLRCHIQFHQHEGLTILPLKKIHPRIFKQLNIPFWNSWGYDLLMSSSSSHVASFSP